MKKIILLFLIMGTYLLSDAQIPKGADKIIIKNEKDASLNFILVKQFLAEKGIEIASQDKDVFQIKTGDIPSKNGSTSFYIILNKDNQIQISGYFNNGFSLSIGSIKDNDPFQPIVNRGMKGSLYWKAFNSMNEFALNLGDDLTYEGEAIKK